MTDTDATQASANPPQTCLGFDYGSQRIGVATGQSLLGSASPLITLNNRQGNPDWQAITALIQEWRPDALILGLPTHADGSVSEVTRAAQDFGKQLQQRYKLPVYTIDERLTSLEAERLLAQQQKKYSKADIDKVAAKLILESWFAAPQSTFK